MHRYISPFFVLRSRNQRSSDQRSIQSRSPTHGGGWVDLRVADVDVDVDAAVDVDTDVVADVAVVVLEVRPQQTRVTWEQRQKSNRLLFATNRRTIWQLEKCPRPRLVSACLAVRPFGLGNHRHLSSVANLVVAPLGRPELSWK